MTIDEAIEKYKEITNTDANCPAHCNISCDKCVQESEQLAVWLEELKAYKEIGTVEECKDIPNIIDGLKIFLQEKFNYCAEQAEMNLEAECNSEIDSYFRDRKELYLDRANIYGKVMREIDRIAGEYNNGWIPCSERLPEDDSICIVTVEYPNNKTMVDYGWFDRKSVCWFVGMQEFRTSNILAWQPLPEPYKESEKNE